MTQRGKKKESAWEQEVDAWRAAEKAAWDEYHAERQRHICTGVNLEMARSEAAFWKRLSLCVIGAVLVTWVVCMMARWM